MPTVPPSPFRGRKSLADFRSKMAVNREVADRAVRAGMDRYRAMAPKDRDMKLSGPYETDGHLVAHASPRGTAAAVASHFDPLEAEAYARQDIAAVLRVDKDWEDTAGAARGGLDEALAAYRQSPPAHDFGRTLHPDIHGLAHAVHSGEHHLHGHLADAIEDHYGHTELAEHVRKSPYHGLGVADRLIQRYGAPKADKRLGRKGAGKALGDFWTKTIADDLRRATLTSGHDLVRNNTNHHNTKFNVGEHDYETHARRRLGTDDDWEFSFGRRSPGGEDIHDATGDMKLTDAKETFLKVVGSFNHFMERRPGSVFFFGDARKEKGGRGRIALYDRLARHAENNHGYHLQRDEAKDDTGKVMQVHYTLTRRDQPHLPVGARIRHSDRPDQTGTVTAHRGRTSGGITRHEVRWDNEERPDESHLFGDEIELVDSERQSQKDLGRRRAPDKALAEHAGKALWDALVKGMADDMRAPGLPEGHDLLHSSDNLHLTSFKAGGHDYLTTAHVDHFADDSSKTWEFQFQRNTPYGSTHGLTGDMTPSEARKVIVHVGRAFNHFLGEKDPAHVHFSADTTKGPSRTELYGVLAEHVRKHHGHEVHVDDSRAGVVDFHLRKPGLPGPESPSQTDKKALRHHADWLGEQLQSQRAGKTLSALDPTRGGALVGAKLPRRGESALDEEPADTARILAARRRGRGETGY